MRWWLGCPCLYEGFVPQMHMEQPRHCFGKDVWERYMGVYSKIIHGVLLVVLWALGAGVLLSRLFSQPPGCQDNGFSPLISADAITCSSRARRHTPCGKNSLWGKPPSQPDCR